MEIKTDHQKKVRQIVLAEWDFFQKVQNEGGRAGCQDDWTTFEIMRTSQFETWSDELLTSYQQDLEEAAEAGRNPLAEKYAYMMKYTSPEEYSRMEKLLPPIPPEKQALVDAAADCQVAWRLEYEERYPALAGRGRPVHSSEDQPWSVSFETYFKGEALTWSERTLRLYAAYVRDLKEQGINQILEVMKHTVAFYGYPDLDAAEKGQKN
ncbi:MAG: DUF4125 family protein [Blautia sp.]|nr:DUF4125 family protein [Blautia sp.]